LDPLSLFGLIFDILGIIFTLADSLFKRQAHGYPDAKPTPFFLPVFHFATPDVFGPGFLHFRSIARFGSVMAFLFPSSLSFLLRSSFSRIGTQNLGRAFGQTYLNLPRTSRCGSQIVWTGVLLVALSLQGNASDKTEFRIFNYFLLIIFVAFVIFIPVS
jgi:hypothetical protein